MNTATGEGSAWREAWASIHNDGSVTIAAAVGGHRSGRDDYFEGWQVEASTIECVIADLMALIQATAQVTDNDEYDVRVGINWTGRQPLSILTRDRSNLVIEGFSTPLHTYTPVETTVNAAESDLDYYWQVHALALDCVNQGGISTAHLIHPPAREEEG